METSRREVLLVVAFATLLALGFSSFNRGTRKRSASQGETKRTTHGFRIRRVDDSANLGDPPADGNEDLNFEIKGKLSTKASISGGEGEGSESGNHDEDTNYGSSRGKILRIAAIGDSITEGDRKHLLKSSKKGDKVKGHLRNYPITLQKMMMGRGCPKLTERYNTTRFMVRNFGQNGKSVGARPADTPFETQYNESMRYNKSLQFDPDLAIFMFGMNDAKEAAWAGKKQFIEDSLELLSKYDTNYQVHRELLESWWKSFSNTTQQKLSKLEKDLPTRVLPRKSLEVLLVEPPPISTKMWDRTAFSVQGDIIETDIREAYLDIFNLLLQASGKDVPELRENRSVLGAKFRSKARSISSSVPPLRLQTIWNRELRGRISKGEPVPKGYRRHPLVLQQNTKPTQLSMDGVHPSRDGAKLIAMAVYQILCEPRNSTYYQELEKEAEDEIRGAKQRERLSVSFQLGETRPPKPLQQE